MPESLRGRVVAGRPALTEPVPPTKFGGGPGLQVPVSARPRSAHPSHVTQGAEGPGPAGVDGDGQRLASPEGAGPEPASGRIAVSLLGGLEVSGGGIRLGPRGLGGTKPRHVLLALLLHRGAPLPKDRLVDLLWDGHPPTGSMATLEPYVCLLRRKLQPLHS